MKKKRDPSLHIRLSQLKDILSSDSDNLFPKKNINLISDFIMKKSQSISSLSRSIEVSNNKLGKKIDKITVSDKVDALLLADCLWAYRTGKLKHRGVRKITQDSRDWADIKELANIVNQFYSDYSNHLKTKRDACIEYIDIAFKSISSSYGLIRKLINMSESIFNYEEGKVRLSSDKIKSNTKYIHDYYCNRISSKTGMGVDYTKTLDKYYKFMEVRELCDKLDIDYDVYIDAQFESLSFRNGIPELSQLVGDKAMERYNKFIYENGMTNKKSEKKKRDISKALSNIKNIR